MTLEDNVDVTIGEKQIRLRGPLRHKIGYAKPLGMGTCNVTIKKLVYFSHPKKGSAHFRILNIQYMRKIC